MNENKEYHIELINLCKYYGDKYIFKNFNRGFERNKITTIVAPSGYGKTTLLNIISGLEDCNGGEVIVKSKNISYMFQEDRIIPWLTVYENIAFVLKSSMNNKEIKERVDRCLKLVRLEDAREMYPEKLSGGMKRRAVLARSLAYKNQILLMDEPFKGLDLKLKEEIIKDFYDLWTKEKNTVILVTHDLKEAELLKSEICYLENK